MASEGQDRADALGWGRLPNRPKTFTRYLTIPQKVTTVSICAKGPGHPEGCPGLFCTLYALASLRATAAEVLRELLCLLARLGVDHDLAYRYPAIVAGVGVLVLVLVIPILSGWVRVVRYGGKVGRGLAVELLSGQQFPDVRNLYLPRSSWATLEKMNPSLKRSIMQVQTLVCSRRS
jgi:hypothetical protein